MTFHPYRMNADPEYWKQLAEEDFQAACILYSHQSANATLLHCHYMLEKILKAIVAQQGKLTDEDADHKLCPLARKAFRKDALSKPEWEFLFDVTRWHIEASYPDDQYIYDILEDANLLKADFTKCCALYFKFRAWYGDNKEQRGAADE